MTFRIFGDRMVTASKPLFPPNRDMVENCQKLWRPQASRKQLFRRPGVQHLDVSYQPNICALEMAPQDRLLVAGARVAAGAGFFPRQSRLPSPALKGPTRERLVRSRGRLNPRKSSTGKVSGPPAIRSSRSPMMSTSLSAAVGGVDGVSGLRAARTLSESITFQRLA